MYAPSILKSLLTAFMMFYIPAYTINYGWRNFLWFSNLMFILTYVGIMTSSQLLVNMAAVGGMLFELIWAFLFFIQLLYGSRFKGFADYMFDGSIPLWLRLLSLFHLFLPPFWIWSLATYGYDPYAWLFQIAFLWCAMAATWLFTDPSKNINWIFEYKTNPSLNIGVILYLFIGGLFVASVIGITHALFLIIFNTRLPAIHAIFLS